MIEIEDVSKAFGGVQALKGVNLKVQAGEIHAVLGENGAGKSTLMKIISGALKKDSGEIRIDGETVNFTTTQSAKDKGIGIIYQEFSLVPELTVAENVYLHQLKDQVMIHWNQLYADADRRIQSLGFQVDVCARVASLSVAHQQVVEIAKALSEDVRVLILDEPSAVLGTSDIQKLFSTLRSLRDQGVAIIYISHHLDEVFQLTDKITVLKDGYTQGTLQTRETTKDELVYMMLGRKLSHMFPDRGAMQASRKPTGVFSIRGVRVLGCETPIDLDVRSGEIIGIGGLVGSGRTEFLRGIFGADAQPEKSIRLNGVELHTGNPGASIASGVGMVPEDRKRHGGLLRRPIRENISLSNYARVSGFMGFINRKKEGQVIADLVDRLKIKLHSPEFPLSSLSGGNQQKVVLAKWLNTEASLLLIDEPTRGVDVGAKTEIYQIIHALSEKGMAIIMVSSDWEELLGLSDRIAVLRQGAVQGIVLRPDFSEEKVLRLAMGAQKTS